MKNDPAFPHEFGDNSYPGLTKREYFAAAALTGIEAANQETAVQGVLPDNEVVKRAVLLTDLLLAELAKGSA